MLMPKYLISTVKRSWAKAIAGDMCLHPHEWYWIPTDDKHKREEALAGMRVESPAFLLGYFTEHERLSLTWPATEVEEEEE